MEDNSRIYVILIGKQSNRDGTPTGEEGKRSVQKKEEHVMLNLFDKSSKNHTILYSRKIIHNVCLCICIGKHIFIEIICMCVCRYVQVPTESDSPELELKVIP